MNRWLMAFVPLSVFLAACATTPEKMYSGPPLPSDQTAILEAAPYVAINKCDGDSVSALTLGILPGTHTIEVTFNEPGVMYSADTCFMVFDAEPGHKYQVDKKPLHATRYQTFIIDRNTDRQIASGCRMSSMSTEDQLRFADKNIESWPREARWRTEKSGILVSTGRYSEALVIAETAISLNPDSAESWYYKARCLYELRRNDEALAALERAASLKPDAPEIRKLQGKMKVSR